MTLSEILLRTSREFALPVSEMTSPTRRQEVCRARNAYILAARFHKYGLSAIGRHINRDHSTVRHGRDRAIILAEKDEEWREQLQRIIHGQPVQFFRHGSLG